MTEQIQTLEFEKEKLNSELMQSYSRLDELNTEKDEEIKIYEGRINNKDNEIKSLKSKVTSILKELEEEKKNFAKIKEEHEENHAKLNNTYYENIEKEKNKLTLVTTEKENTIKDLQYKIKQHESNIEASKNKSKEYEDKLIEHNNKINHLESNIKLFLQNWNYYLIMSNSILVLTLIWVWFSFHSLFLSSRCCICASLCCLLICHAPKYFFSN